MPIYSVPYRWTETHSGFIEVEASDKQDLQNKVEEFDLPCITSCDSFERVEDTTVYYDEAKILKDK